ncbi:restriction endonuclease subunit S [Halorubrum halodurans]|uniref:Type I restriction modification DNA specificity domain-containing protein n=1 Tax=Halorubrum halodurans TaxID=1383851 RepID=A0A256IPE5_9EURY|nr:restriction endonuclease subunit S [Halorubrum halodurans]OYR58156.1 hypothetical protein DJ70_03900 [Halorubrum halodurans]
MSEDLTLDEFQQVEPEENSEWQESNLDDLLSDLLTGSRPTGGGLDEGKYISIGGTQIDSEGYIDLHDLVYIPDNYFEQVQETQLQKHDILVVKDGANTGDVAIAWESDDRIVTNEHLFTLRADSTINPPYLFYFLLSHQGWKQINGTITGSAQEGINRGFTGKVDIQYPSVSEQRKIATVLYTVDRAIEKTQEIKDQLKRVRDGVRQDIFYRGVQKTGFKRTVDELKEIYLGTIPKDWKLRRVNDVCSHVVDCPHSTPSYSEEGTPVVRTSEIEDGRYYPEESPRVDEQGYQNRISRLEPKPGDVVFTREAPIGEAFKIPEGMRLCLGQRLIQFRPEEGVLDPDFFIELLYSDMIQSWFERSARGSTSTHINVGDIKKMNIPIPSIEEQYRIVNILGGFRKQLDSEQNLLSTYKCLKRGLQQDLLSGTVRTIDTNIEVPDEIAQHG